MRYIFKFPDIGEGLDEGTIAEWYVQKGQQVEMGEPLVKMETDKVVTDIPSPRDGIVAALYGRVGETIHVGSPLVEFDLPGIDGADAVSEVQKPVFEPVNEEGAGVVGTLEVADNSAYLPPTDEVAPTPTAEKPLPRRALATPVARAMARELGVNIDLVSGTGPAGRVMKEDIENYVKRESSGHYPPYQTAASTAATLNTASARGGRAAAGTVVPPASEAFEIQPLSQIRKTIARNMIRSKQNAAHMTVFDEVEVSELIRIRYKYKEAFEKEGIRLSYLPFILKATALALKQHPVLNAELDLDNNRMILKKHYNIGIAVDTDDGLVVPVIRQVDEMTIRALATAVNTIAEKARRRDISMEDMKDGTFTITNFGSIGGQFAVPVINYPQSGILGIGRMVQKPVVKDNQVVPGTVLPLSLSVDHRIVDGGEVTRFLNKIMEYLGDPVSLIIG
ncbi:MAG: dihydrolipoamide acetyltransferase family protein [Bacteroidales bacterium]|nr:dihydrolipoamide acetyltransferase family protein [Bacteroidales bacterium]